MKKIIKNISLKINWDRTANLLAATTGAFALIFSTCQYRRGVEIEAKTNRPFISVVDFKMGYDTVPDLGFQPVLTLKNFGQRPAYDVRIRNTIASVNNKMIYKVIDDVDFPFSSIYVPDVNFALGTILVRPVNPELKYLIKLRFEYSDPISDNRYVDSIYFYWRYQKETVFKVPQIMGLEKSMADDLETFLQSRF